MKQNPTLARALTFASFVLTSCGGAKDSPLFFSDTAPELQGTGGRIAAELGSGGLIAVSSGGSEAGSGGSAGAGSAPPDASGQDASDASRPDASVPPPDASSTSDATANTHTDTGAGDGTGGPEASTPSGPWTRCSDDSDCVDGRVCTAAAQSILVSGRAGACVHHCLLGSSGCDAPMPGATVSCMQLLVDSFCTFTCSGNARCPAGFDCVSGTCFYAK